MAVCSCVISRRSPSARACIPYATWLVCSTVVRPVSTTSTYNMAARFMLYSSNCTLNRYRYSAFSARGRKLCNVRCTTKGRSYRKTFLKIFVLFFPRKIGKTGNIFKVWKFSRGQILGTLRIPIFGKEMGKNGNENIARFFF